MVVGGGLVGYFAVLALSIAITRIAWDSKHPHGASSANGRRVAFRGTPGHRDRHAECRAARPLGAGCGQQRKCGADGSAL